MVNDWEFLYMKQQIKSAMVFRFLSTIIICSVSGFLSDVNASGVYNEFKNSNKKNESSVVVDADTVCVGLSALSEDTDPATQSLEATSKLLAEEIQKMKNTCEIADGNELGSAINVENLKNIKNSDGKPGSTLKNAEELTKQIKGTLDILDAKNKCPGGDKATLSQKASKFLRMITPAVERLGNKNLDLANTVLQASLGVISSVADESESDLGKEEVQNNIGRAICELYKTQHYLEKLIAKGGGLNAINKMKKDYFTGLELLTEEVRQKSDDVEMIKALNARKKITVLGVHFFSELNFSLNEFEKSYYYAPELRPEIPPSNFEKLLDLVNLKSSSKDSLAGLTEDLLDKVSEFNKNVGSQSLYSKFIDQLKTQIEATRAQFFKNELHYDRLVEADCFNSNLEINRRKCWDFAKKSFVIRGGSMDLSKTVIKKYIERLAVQFANLTEKYDATNLGSFNNDIFIEWNNARENLGKNFDLLFVIKDETQMLGSAVSAATVKEKLTSALKYLYLKPEDKKPNMGKNGIVYKWLTKLVEKANKQLESSKYIISEINNSIANFKKESQFVNSCPGAFSKVSQLSSDDTVYEKRSFPIIQFKDYVKYLKEIGDFSTYVEAVSEEYKKSIAANNTKSGVFFESGVLFEDLTKLNDFLDGVNKLQDKSTSVLQKEVRACYEFINSNLGIDQNGNDRCVLSRSLIESYDELDTTVKRIKKICEYTNIVLGSSIDEKKVMNEFCIPRKGMTKADQLNALMNESMLETLTSEVGSIERRVCR
jgi:hypothetical protein